MVELSVIMPFLFILALGTFEFGRALQHHHIIGKGVRDAARFLARVQVTCLNGGQGVGTVNDPNDVTRAQRLALTGDVNGGPKVIDYWDQLSEVAVAVDCLDNTTPAIPFRVVNAANTIPTIRVTANVQYQDLGFLAILGLTPPTFVVKHEQVNIGA